MEGLRRSTIDQTTIIRVVAAGALTLALAAAAWLWTPPGEPLAAEPGPTAVAAPSLTVHVSGAVVRPGLVQLAAGGRVADAVAAAGGTLGSADLSALNLAAPVRDGEQIHVPDVTADSGRGVGTVDDGRIRINSASAGELQSLPGVGPVLAQRIVAFREEHGPISSPEDLLDVPGIGEAKLDAMRDLLAVP